MAGIERICPYIPSYRLGGETFAGAWGGGGKTSRSVAGPDEDTVTMAVQAGLSCLEGTDPARVGRLFFASCSPPYLEHPGSAIAASALDLKNDLMSQDLCGSVRSGLAALRLAFEAAKNGDAGKSIVCAADIRPAKPGDPMERTIGDGAAAVLIGSDNVVAEVEGFHSTTSLFLERWRKTGDEYTSAGDAKFINDHGIMAQLPAAVQGLLDKCDASRDEIAKVVYYCPDRRLRKALDKKLGFAPGAYLAGDPQKHIGDTGNAQPLIALARAIEEGKPGDRIVAAAQGGGAEACLLRLTDAADNYDSGLSAELARARELSSYARYLGFRGFLPGDGLDIWTSAPVLWREERANMRLLGQRCGACGEVQFPPRYHCGACGSKDLAEMKMSRKGAVLTFTVDTLVPALDPPMIMAAADLEGGGRIYGQMADASPEAMKIGLPVELVFRKIHGGGGFNNYFWKFRPRAAAPG